MFYNQDVYGELVDLVNLCKEKANQNGERFNIFSILRAHRKETGTHSRFLYELLNPKGRHGEGSEFLDIFLSDVLGLMDARGPFKVSRELQTEEKRRVDIAIESPQCVIGIELKIDAADQKAQLYDYYKELQRRASGGKKAILVYLTLDGKTASASSTTDLDENDVLCLSFAEDIAAWLQSCIEKSAHKPILMHAIQQYSYLLASLTGSGGSVSELLATALGNDAEKFEAVLHAAKALPKAKSSIQRLFWEEISEEIQSRIGVKPSVYGGASLKSISNDYYSKKQKKHVGIKTPVCNVDENRVFLYINLYDAVHYGLRMENTAGNVIFLPEVREAFRKVLIEGNAKSDSFSDWLVCHYFNPSQGSDDKTIIFNEFNHIAISLLVPDTRSALIRDMVNHQIELMESAKSLARMLTVK